MIYCAFVCILLGFEEHPYPQFRDFFSGKCRERQEWNTHNPLNPTLSNYVDLLDICTEGRKSHNPCYHKKYMEAAVMNFVAHCTVHGHHVLSTLIKSHTYYLLL